MRLSPSLAKILIQQSPKHAYLEATKPRDEVRVRSAPMRFGAAVDRLVFNTGDEITIKVLRGQQELPGQILVTEKELARANLVAGQVISNGAFRPKGSQGLCVQEKLAWVDSTLLINLVSKPDYMDRLETHGKDLKTAWNVSDYSITRDIERYGYDIQAAAYVDAMKNCLGWPDPGFQFVFAKTSPDYDVIVRPLEQEEMERGQSLWQEAKVIWKRCLESGEWPDTVNPKYIARQIKTKTWMDS